MRYLAILTIMIILLASCTSLTENKMPAAKDVSYNGVSISEKTIKADSIYAFTLKNNELVKKNCSADLEIVNDGKLIDKKTKIIGIIDANETISVEIPFDSMPEGATSFSLVPNCKNAQ